MHHARSSVQFKLKSDHAIAIRFRHRNELDDQLFTGFDFNSKFLVDLHATQEGTGIQSIESAIFVFECHVFVKYSWVHCMRKNVHITNRMVGFSAPLFRQLSSSSFKVVWFHFGSRTTFEASQTISTTFNSASLQNTRAQRFRETMRRNSQKALEIFDDRLWERQVFCFVNDFLFGQIISHQELSQISGDFGTRSDLDDVSQQSIGSGVCLFHLRPLPRQPKLGALEQQVGVLTSGHLMMVDVR